MQPLNQYSRKIAGAFFRSIPYFVHVAEIRDKEVTEFEKIDFRKTSIAFVRHLFAFLFETFDVVTVDQKKVIRDDR